IRLRQIFRKQAHAAGGVEAIHALKRDLLFLTFRQVKSWIGEVQAAVWSADHVVRTIKFLAFEIVGENFVFPIFRYFDNGPQYGRAIDQAPMLIVRAAVGVAERDDFFFPSITHVNTENFV